jgi:hypothetical protein
VQLCSARGSLRTHEVRAVKSKSPEVRAASQAIVESALKEKAAALKALGIIEERQKEQPQQQPRKRTTTTTTTTKTIPTHVIKQLQLTPQQIKEIEWEGDKWRMKVQNYERDEEEIDEIVVEVDESEMGWSVEFCQVYDDDVQEWETIFVYK